jgi:hypothetical protein
MMAGDLAYFFRRGYDINIVPAKRVEELIQVNLHYRISEMTKDFNRMKETTRECRQSKGKARLDPQSNHSDSSSGCSEAGRLYARKMRETEEQNGRRYARRIAVGISHLVLSLQIFIVDSFLPFAVSAETKGDGHIV